MDMLAMSDPNHPNFYIFVAFHTFLLNDGSDFKFV